MNVPSEFSHILRVTQLRQGPQQLTLTADEDQRAALARRFDLAALDRLTATVTVRLDGEQIWIDGTLTAAVTQSCVATAVPMPITLDEAITLLALIEPDSDAADSLELDDDPEGRDVIHYDGAAIDIGEAVAQTLLLSLDPYPRHADADAFLKARGVLSEEEARLASSPFAALQRKNPTPE